jgi:hypothetical protein
MVYKGIGYKYVNGQKTETVAVVVGVEQKKPRAQVSPHEMIPTTIDGIPTDVQENPPIRAWSGRPMTIAHSHTARVRPVPPGVSIGHEQTTAGTHGGYVQYGTDTAWYGLSNNHVVANENRAQRGDRIYQPGPYDIPEQTPDAETYTIATLETFVRLGPSTSGCLWWPFTRRQERRQPYPNLVDAAIYRMRTQDDVELAIQGSGRVVRGIRDMVLGDRCYKVGRTTGYTDGVVEIVNMEIPIHYDAGVWNFVDQLGIRHRTNGEMFSAPGDSGSWVLSHDDYFGALLFAGGGGVTIANPVAHVVALLGVRLPAQRV